MTSAMLLGRDHTVRMLGRKFDSLIDPGATVAVREVDALDLLRPDRLDIVIKLRYAQARLDGVSRPWWRELYLAHLAAFNGYYESDGSGKLGASTFCRSFDQLIDGIAKGGLRPDTIIPISRDGVPLDGAHRIAACIALGLPIRVVATNVERGPRYGADFFETRGLAPRLCDLAVGEYVTARPNARAVLVWPTADGRDRELAHIVTEHAEIIHERSLFLSPRGGVHLVARTYEEEPWLGSASNDFAGARNKARQCFGGTGPLRVYFVESDAASLLRCKTAIRELFGNGKHSVHINDSHRESVRLADLTLNRNSVDFMNSAPLVAPSWFRRLFVHYDKWLAEIEGNGAEATSYCVDGSAVLAAHGLRDARDLDYLCVAASDPGSGFREIAQHTDAERYLGVPVGDIVGNPAHHFDYWGRKMATLGVVENMKRARGEPKDLADLQLVRDFRSGRRTRPPLTYRAARALRPARLRGRAKLAAFQVRFLCVAGLRRMHRDGTRSS